MATIISSQRYTNDEIVASKLASQDYTVTLSPAFAVDGIEYQVILDGHHSLEASRLAGVDPEYVEADKRTADTVALLSELVETRFTRRLDCDPTSMGTAHQTLSPVATT